MMSGTNPVPLFGCPLHYHFNLNLGEGGFADHACSLNFALYIHSFPPGVLAPSVGNRVAVLYWKLFSLKCLAQGHPSSNQGLGRDLQGRAGDRKIFIW